MRKIARRKENSSPDFCAKPPWISFICFSDVRKWRFVQASRSEDVLGQPPVVEVWSVGDFK
jgi:hypothetical protein